MVDVFCMTALGNLRHRVLHRVRSVRVLHSSAAGSTCLSSDQNLFLLMVLMVIITGCAQVGHALVSTAVAKLLPGSASVQKLSIIPRTGGALGFTYIPPNTEDRALMFDSEIKGQLAMLMGGRAAEQLTCASVSTGARNVLVCAAVALCSWPSSACRLQCYYSARVNARSTVSMLRCCACTCMADAVVCIDTFAVVCRRC